jgi:hypothetical protein
MGETYLERLVQQACQEFDGVHFDQIYDDSPQAKLDIKEVSIWIGGVNFIFPIKNVDIEDLDEESLLDLIDQIIEKLIDAR